MTRFPLWILLLGSYLHCGSASGTSIILQHPAMGIGNPNCLSTPELEAALLQSAMRLPTHEGNTRPAVILTNCDFRCFETLFEPFMSAIANSSGGGFSQHVSSDGWDKLNIRSTGGIVPLWVRTAFSLNAFILYTYLAREE